MLGAVKIEAQFVKRKINAARVFVDDRAIIIELISTRAKNDCASDRSRADQKRDQ